MSITGKWIELIYRVATGGWKTRLVLAPIAGLCFLTLIGMFVLLSFVTDRYLGLPVALVQPWGVIAGACLIVAGLFLTLISIAHFLRVRGTPVPFSPPPELVTSGLYRYARNPMLTGIFLQLFGLGIARGSVSLMAVFTPLFIAINVWELKHVEEPELEKRLGNAYVEYKRRVPMFFPWRLAFNRATMLPLVALALLVAAMLYQLHCQGRSWWCTCGQPFLWSGDIWCAHNSQHLVDPYSFSHMLHGVLFCGLLWLILPRVRLGWRLCMALCIEAGWEIFENSQFIIQRYREGTIAQGYEGDSMINSMGDVACCALGFMLARRLGLWRSVALYAVTELIMLACVRDNLTLNVLMLICPIEAIKSWQMH